MMAAILPKKRRPSHDGTFSSSSSQRQQQQDTKRRKASADSQESQTSSHKSEDTTTLALRVLIDVPSVPLQSTMSICSASSRPPPKKRKPSFDVSQIADVRRRKQSFDSVSEGPFRKRINTFDAETRFRCTSIGSIDDVALGLAPLAAPTHSMLDVTLKDTTTTTAATAANTMTLPTILPPTNNHSKSALDHLEALGDEASSLHSVSRLPPLQQQQLMPRGTTDDAAGGENSSGGTMTSGNQRLLLEALMKTGEQVVRRSRFESWGGMSDISTAMDMDGATAALAASALDCVVGDVPAKITTDRKPSVASLSESSSAINSQSSPPGIQAFVAAAMADQLAELAGVVETVVGSASSVTSDVLKEIPKDGDASVASGTSISLPEINDEAMGRPRSLSTSSKAISVDYDAVAAAVDAADAATAALDLTSISGMQPPLMMSMDGGCSKTLSFSTPTKTERDMDAIRARARAAAGYVPPSEASRSSCAKKKRAKPVYSLPLNGYTATTPRKSNTYMSSTPSSVMSASSKASSQKWDEMFDCLIQFIDQRRQDETKNLPDPQKESWEWDGNVPTTYKTKDGKALGRWINNQRSAKHKGNLKKERELKLDGTGLKWSVLSTNSWHVMMEELRIYVREKTKDGQAWDGNVPTNYKIKGGNGEGDEDKNLGRWINRQRSLYQAGRLRKDRQAELDQIGLKWSVLSTTTWQTMFDTLVTYVKDQKEADPNGQWDGNVPASHKTNDNPPKALGRWINRQRSAYIKGRLKKEFVDRLNSIGLKWSVHERRTSVPSTPQAKLPAALPSTPGSAITKPGSLTTPLSVKSSVTTALTPGTQQRHNAAKPDAVASASRVLQNTAAARNNGPSKVTSS